MVCEVDREETLSSVIELYNANMGDTVQKLEKNKKYQYIKYLYDNFGYDLIDAVIDICILYKLSSPFAFFKAVCEDYIAQGITTREEVEKARMKRKGRFNTAGRDYNYESLERKLLGWE